MDDFSAGGMSPEDIQAKKQMATQKRIRILGVLIIVAVLARIFIKDPEPPVAKKPQNVRYVAGTLEKLTVAQQQALSPQQYAAMLAADRAKAEKIEKEEREALGIYTPQEEPVQNPEDIAAQKEEAFVYAKRRKAMEKRRKEIEEAKLVLKAKIVELRNGGYLQADHVARAKRESTITLDPHMTTRLSNRSIRRVFDNSREWKEPIQKGYVKLNPAKGITITVAKRISKRISIKKEIILDEES